VTVAPDRFLRTRDDVAMNDTRSIDANEDPVCGMRVDPDAARVRGLTFTHEGREYAFCGKGCLLDFKDDPATYLAEEYRPSM
jgi:YHS domain-containing protein